MKCEDKIKEQHIAEENMRGRKEASEMIFTITQKMFIGIVICE